MGWIKTEIQTTAEIFNDVIKNTPSYNGYVGDSSSPYEYWVDNIKNNYDVTLEQCDELCQMIKRYYDIKNFYYKK